MTSSRKSFDARLTPEAWTAGEPVVIVSADSHATLPATQYGQYLDPAYSDDFARYIEDHTNHRKLSESMGYPFPPDVLEVIDTRGAIESGGETGYFDPDRRLREVEAEGIVAEFLHPLGPLSFTPFYDNHNRPSSHELRAAGARAHNRFIADLCSAAPGRLLGVPLVYPWPDPHAMTEQCRQAADGGFKAIYAPVHTGVDLPAFYDPWWDPLWAGCQEYGLAVHIHAGFGGKQGGFAEVAKAAEDAARAAGVVWDLNHFDPESEVQESPLGKLFAAWGERRPLWQLMWGGVFDRFPHLRVVFVEIHADWVPPTLEYLDARYEQEGRPFGKSPSECWRDHFAVGASLMRIGEVEMRHEIGVEKLMFGSDYPHMEGSWPNTHDWIRATLATVPEDEARGILGLNAVDFYGLDRELLERTARRIGPFPGAILGTHQHVDAKILRHFDFRAGLNKPASFDPDRLEQDFIADERAARSIQTS